MYRNLPKLARTFPVGLLPPTFLMFLCSLYLRSFPCALCILIVLLGSPYLDRALVLSVSPIVLLRSLYLQSCSCALCISGCARSYMGEEVEETLSLDDIEEESDLAFTEIKLGKRRTLTLSLASRKKKKSLTVQEKVFLIRTYQFNPSDCTYALMEEAGWLGSFSSEMAPLKMDEFKLLEECKCTDSEKSKAYLISFRASAHTSTEAAVVQAITISVVHIVEELNTRFGCKTFQLGNEWPVASRHRRSDMAIFTIKNARTYVVIEVKETISIDLEKSPIKKILSQLLYEIVLLSAKEGAVAGTRYLGVMCDDYTFHSLVVTMNECLTFEAVAEKPVESRPFALSEYTTSSGKGGEALESLCRVVQSFVKGTKRM